MSRQTWSPFFIRHRKKVAHAITMITIHQAICPPGAVPQGRHLHFTEDATLHNDSKNTWDACRRLPDPNLTFTMKTMANTAAKNSSRGTGSTPLGSTLRGLKKPGPGKWLTDAYSYILSGGWFEPLWKIWVSWDYYSQYMEKKLMFQTSNQLY